MRMASVESESQYRKRERMSGSDSDMETAKKGKKLDTKDFIHKYSKHPI
jgi:hypothetical protein